MRNLENYNHFLLEREILNKNYKFKILKNETFVLNGYGTLFRIQALRDIKGYDGFKDVKCGDKGGFVRNEHNLSQRGDSWIYEDCLVYGERSYIYDNCQIKNCKIADNIWSGGDCRIENAFIFYRKRTGEICLRDRLS